ncbi:MAG: hypothetical protein ACI9G1_002359 [Pirellulaceae bacterium]|jgi:hypothetical protein
MPGHDFHRFYVVLSAWGATRYLVRKVSIFSPEYTATINRSRKVSQNGTFGGVPQTYFGESKIMAKIKT